MNGERGVRASEAAMGDFSDDDRDDGDWSRMRAHLVIARAEDLSRRRREPQYIRTLNI